MRHILAAAALLFGTAISSAATFQDIDGEWYLLVDPPARYATGEAKVTITEMERTRLTTFCEPYVNKQEPHGCAVVINGPLGRICQIAIAVDLPHGGKSAVLRHETAHCHGWPADHPTD